MISKNNNIVRVNFYVMSFAAQQYCIPILFNVLRLYTHNDMADVWYQNLEKSFRINKNIDRAFFSVDNTPIFDKTKCQLSFATDCISNQVTHKCRLNVDWQMCVMKTVTYRARTER